MLGHAVKTWGAYARVSVYRLTAKIKARLYAARFLLENTQRG